MTKYISKLSQEDAATLRGYIADLETIVESEATAAFESLIDEYAHLNIYTLGLYYDAGSWRYLVPTLSTEQGLEHAASHYAKDWPMSPDELQVMLRWSPCDSPHHGDEALDRMMPDTEQLLQRIRRFLDQAHPITGRGQVTWQVTDTTVDWDFYIAFITEVHEQIRYAVRTALKKVRETPVIQAFLEDSSCVISLSAGDIDEKIILEDIKFINGEEAWKRVEQESTQAMEASALANERWEEKLEQERENPPTTNLTLDDFAELIEQFEPEFMEMDGGVFVKRTYDYPLRGDSESEALANRFKLMELLKSSVHYEELDQLYGYFLGVNFSEGDLLPTLCEAFVEKLGNRLEMAFGDRSFKIYMVVDRSTLYHFTFCTERDDGYKFPRYCEHSEGGVERVIRLP